MSSGRRQPDQLALQSPQKTTPSAQLAVRQAGAQFFDDLRAQFRDVVGFPAIVWPDIEFGYLCRAVGCGAYFLGDVLTQTPGRGAYGTGARARGDRGVSPC
jgi:hypothetical protein